MDRIKLFRVIAADAYHIYVCFSIHSQNHVCTFISSEFVSYKFRAH